MGIEITDFRIINFFKENHLDPEDFILSMIDLYKLINTGNNTNNTNNNTNISQNEVSINSIVKCVQDQLTQFTYKFQSDILLGIINNREPETNKIQEQLEKIKIHLEDFNNKFKVSSTKGKMAEDLFYKELLDIFPETDIQMTRYQSSCGDFIMKSEKCDILMDIKNYSRNVDKDEIEKFKRDCSLNNCSGILISTNGICNKKNFGIDLHDKRILVYIHNFDYSREKIIIAVNIINYLTEIFSEIKNYSGFTTEQVDKIKEQYIDFLNTREAGLVNLKEFYTKQLKFYMSMDIDILRNAFLTDVSLNDSLKCDVCGLFKTDNKKSLANHKRRCKSTTKLCQD